MTNKPKDQEFQDLERQLAAIQPSSPRLDRERLLFRAGWEAAQAERNPVRTTGWLWPLATAAACLLATGLAWRLYQVESPAPVQPVAERTPTPGEVAPRESTASASRDTLPPLRGHYLDRRRLALTRGVDLLAGPLPAGSDAPGQQLRYRDWKDQLWKLETGL